MAPAAERKWTCRDCGVSVSRLDGGRAPLPESWAECAEGELCLACRRQRAAEAALDAAPADSTRDARFSLRRAGLIEFEVRRAPERPDSAIAKACQTSSAAVAAARQRLSIPQA